MFQFDVFAMFVFLVIGIGVCVCVCVCVTEGHRKCIDLQPNAI